MNPSDPRIKPIQTVWNGYKFRSRLEARWAVFFETLGLTWEYEKEGFILPSGRPYLPDFFIQGLGWFEIKPKPLDFNGQPWTEEGSLEQEFFDEECFHGHHGDGGGVLFGTPGPVDPIYSEKSSYAGTIGCDSPYFFVDCPDCGAIGFEFDGRSARVSHNAGCPIIGSRDDKNYNLDSPRILAAASKARSARFEHGEQP